MKKEEVIIEEITLDEDVIQEPPVMVPVEPIETMSQRGKASNKNQPKEKVLINCLRDEKVIVRYILKIDGKITDPKHALYGHMAETAIKCFSVPRLASGVYKNVLTNSEKDFLESVMGLEENALSVYLKNNNFWSNYFVRLTKQDNILYLAQPEDYIKYKILLANDDFIAPNLDALTNNPKASYQFVIVAERDEVDTLNENMSASMEASILLGTIMEKKKVLKLIVETLSGKPISDTVKMDFLKAEAFKVMQANPKLFIREVKNPMLETKVFIKDCVDTGLIRKRGDLYYIADSMLPMTDDGDPTLTNACKFINHPRRQEVKLMLEAKLKSLRD